MHKIIKTDKSQLYTEKEMTGPIIRIAITLTMMLVILTGCAGFNNYLRFLTGSKNVEEAELKKLYGDGTAFDYVWASGADGSITFNKSGSAFISYGEKQDSGSWKIAGNMLCTSWQELGAGEEHCYTVYSRRRGAKYKLFNADGSYHATAVSK